MAAMSVSVRVINKRTFLSKTPRARYRETAVHVGSPHARRESNYLVKKPQSRLTRGLINAFDRRSHRCVHGKKRLAIPWESPWKEGLSKEERKRVSSFEEQAPHHRLVAPLSERRGTSLGLKASGLALRASGHDFVERRLGLPICQNLCFGFRGEGGWVILKGLHPKP